MYNHIIQKKKGIFNSLITSKKEITATRLIFKITAKENHNLWLIFAKADNSWHISSSLFFFVPINRLEYHQRVKRSIIMEHCSDKTLLGNNIKWL